MKNVVAQIKVNFWYPHKVEIMIMTIIVAALAFKFTYANKTDQTNRTPSAIVVPSK